MTESPTDLLGVGFAMLSVSIPLSIVLLKLFNGKKRGVPPCDSCTKLTELVDSFSHTVRRYEQVVDRQEDWLPTLKAVRRHLALQGVDVTLEDTE